MQPGDRVRDCVLEKRIGAGGMGEVWRAYHHVLRRPVAVKIIHEQHDGPAFRQRFQREAEAMTRLSHPHIVAIHDFFVAGRRAYLVMELIEGGSLADRGRVSCTVALGIAREILDALNFAHQRGVVHRDVKPSNVLVDRSGHAYMTDFGIALVAGTERLTRLTRSGTAVGTPEYMSPEQITTPASIDHRTDVYSFGCVLYEMLSGQPPFGSRDNGATDFALMHAHVKQAPVSIRRRNPDVDRNTARVIARALQKDPDRRFAGCGEMAQALAGVTAPIRPSPAIGRLGHVLFSLHGRVTRAALWQGVAAVIAQFVLTAFVAVSAPGEYGLLLVGISSLVGAWAAIAIAVKRSHDLDHSALWLLWGALLVPLPWIAFSLLLRRGTDGENRFGSTYS